MKLPSKTRTSVYDPNKSACCGASMIVIGGLLQCSQCGRHTAGIDLPKDVHHLGNGGYRKTFKVNE